MYSHPHSLSLLFLLSHLLPPSSFPPLCLFSASSLFLCLLMLCDCNAQPRPWQPNDKRASSLLQFCTQTLPLCHSAPPPLPLSFCCSFTLPLTQLPQRRRSRQQLLLQPQLLPMRATTSLASESVAIAVCRFTLDNRQHFTCRLLWRSCCCCCCCRRAPEHKYK